MALHPQVIPDEEDYVFQANSMARAAHKTPVMARRLVFVAMAQVRAYQESPSWIEMKANDLRRALGMADAGGYRDELRDASKALLSHVFDIDTPTGWQQFQWANEAQYIKSRDVYQIKLSMATFTMAKAMGAHAKIQLADLAKFQGQYALRIFEMIVADHGHEGKNGNKPGTWFTDLMFEDLRVRFKILPTEYAGRTGKNDFRKNVIDFPIQEINAANVGIKITPDYDRFRATDKLPPHA